jgi:hypothetical protein
MTVTFAEAAAEYLRFSEEDRGCKPSTVRNYRNAIRVHLLPVFGEIALEVITVQEIEPWRAGMSSARQRRELRSRRRTAVRRRRSTPCTPRRRARASRRARLVTTPVEIPIGWWSASDGVVLLAAAAIGPR